MTAPPDFEQIAYSILMSSHNPHVFPHHIGPAAEELKRIWNARGAADLEAAQRWRMRIFRVDVEDCKVTIDAAIKKLDR